MDENIRPVTKVNRRNAERTFLIDIMIGPHFKGRYVGHKAVFAALGGDQSRLEIAIHCGSEASRDRIVCKDICNRIDTARERGRSMSDVENGLGYAIITADHVKMDGCNHPFDFFGVLSKVGQRSIYLRRPNEFDRAPGP